jgi:hypothetical protein
VSEGVRERLADSGPYPCVYRTLKVFMDLAPDIQRRPALAPPVRGERRRRVPPLCCQSSRLVRAPTPRDLRESAPDTPIDPLDTGSCQLSVRGAGGESDRDPAIPDLVHEHVRVGREGCQPCGGHDDRASIPDNVAMAGPNARMTVSAAVFTLVAHLVPSRQERDRSMLFVTELCPFSDADIAPPRPIHMQAGGRTVEDVGVPRHLSCRENEESSGTRSPELGRSILHLDDENVSLAIDHKTSGDWIPLQGRPLKREWILSLTEVRTTNAATGSAGLESPLKRAARTDGAVVPERWFGPYRLPASR